MIYIKLFVNMVDRITIFEHFHIFEQYCVIVFFAQKKPQKFRQKTFGVTSIIPIYSFCRYYSVLLLGLEYILAKSTKWTCPLFGNILPACACSNAILGVALRWIIDIVTRCANVLFHNVKFLMLWTIPYIYYK